MHEQIFVSVKDQLGYAEECIIVKSKDQKESQLLKYSLSNSLEDIKIAIYSKTGQNVNLETARWRINKESYISVKHLMNKHRVTYSMTTWEEKTRYLVVNMRVNDRWFSTYFAELYGSFVSEDCLQTYARVRDYINKILSEETDDEK